MNKFLLLLMMAGRYLIDARRLGDSGSFGKQSFSISWQIPSYPTHNLGNTNQPRPATPP